MMSVHRQLAVLVGVFALCCSQRLQSDDPRPREAAGTPVSTVALSPAEESAALEFATIHHPHLATLVRRLKKQNPPEYAKAVADIHKASEQVNRWQERMPARYQVELDLWKVDSRIRLLAARMATQDRPALEQELRQLLNDRVNLRISLMNLDRDRVQQRLDRLDETIRQAADEREAAIDRDIERLLRQARTHATRSLQQVPSAHTPDGASPAGRKPANAPTSSQVKPDDQTSGDLHGSMRVPFPAVSRHVSTAIPNSLA